MLMLLSFGNVMTTIYTSKTLEKLNKDRSITKIKEMYDL